jgi:hypothetical protein
MYKYIMAETAAEKLSGVGHTTGSRSSALSGPGTSCHARCRSNTGQAHASWSIRRRFDALRPRVDVHAISRCRCCQPESCGTTKTTSDWSRHCSTRHIRCL